MCPLGKDCPGFIGYRWPNSEIPTIVPLGAGCVFAHTHNELRFKQEIRSRKKMLIKEKNRLLEFFEKNQQTKIWNPAGGVISDCIGCGEQIGKPGAKAICTFC